MGIDPTFYLFKGDTWTAMEPFVDFPSIFLSFDLDAAPPYPIFGSCILLSNLTKLRDSTFQNSIILSCYRIGSFRKITIKQTEIVQCKSSECNKTGGLVGGFVGK